MTAQRITKEPQFNLLQKVTLFLLVLAGMNFYNQYKILCLVAGLLFLFCKMKFVVNQDVVVLMALSVSWVALSPTGTKTVPQMIMPFTFPLAYCVGLNFLPTNNQEKAEKGFRKAVVIASAGPFIHFILNYLYNMGKSVDRSTNDFWTKEMLSATGQAPLALMMLTVAIVTLFTNASSREKLISVIILVAIFLYNLTLAGRTLFVMLILVFAVSLLFLMIKGDKKGKKYKTLLIIVVIVLALVILYNTNVFGIQDTIESSNFYDRFFGQWSKDLDEDSRMDSKMKYLDNFSKGMWGGLKLRPHYGYAHDILLDTYDEAGIIALVAMLVFLVSSVIRMVHFIKKDTLNFEIRQLSVGMYTAILMQFMVEPILQGLPWLFMLFCFIHGMVTCLEKTYEGANIVRK